MKKLILFAVSFLATNAAWAQQPSAATPNSSTETVSADNVPIEEYVPQVIIEGKWGNEPGEFGVAWTYANDTSSPMSPSGSESMPIYPSSLAVDGKGNIYVLDTINNRIQKFDAEGKFLKAIHIDAYMGEEQPIWYGKVKTEDGMEILDRVESKDKSGRTIGVDKWFPFYWPITAQGINIVIDSKDNLYYYLKRSISGKETEEVWEFKGDKVVKKTSFSKKESLPAKFELHLVGHNQWELGIVETATSVKKSYKHRINIRKEKEDSVIEVDDNSGKQVSKTLVKPSEAYQRAKAKYGRAKSEVYFEKVLENGNFQVRTVNGDLENISTEEREYTPEGKLVRRIKSPPGYSHGIDVGENGVKVVRWVIQKSN